MPALVRTTKTTASTTWIDRLATGHQGHPSRPATLGRNRVYDAAKVRAERAWFAYLVSRLLRITVVLTGGCVRHSP